MWSTTIIITQLCLPASVNGPARTRSQVLIGVLLFVSLLSLCAVTSVKAQQQPQADESTVNQQAVVGSAADQFEIEPDVSDSAIELRLSRIMNATEWFNDLKIHVNEGVVFLDGRTTAVGYKDWGTELARKTKGVIAVVNRLQLIERSPWELSPAWNEIQHIWGRILQQLPRFGLGLLVLGLFALLAKLLAVIIRRALTQRLKPLLRDVAARLASIPVVLLGVYLMLQIGGLSGLAATVLGGTGIAGLIAGIAFRDILENYLASILMSLRNPFKFNDLIEVANHTGIVQRVTTRGTVLMNLDGNHVQIPNSMVYKSIILNYTANPNRRETFTVGIGYENDTAAAQAVALEVLDKHPAVLKDPEALVLVDQLGAATVDLQVSFWYVGTIFNGPKIRSSVIRLVKRAFDEDGISMPDEAREVIFPDGVPVRMIEHELKAEQTTGPQPAIESDRVKVSGEGDLASEEEQLRKQARQARIPEEGIDLLQDSD